MQPSHPALPTLVILAAGLGARFRAAGGHTHKLDAPLAGIPVLQRSLDAARQSGLRLHVVRPGDGGDGMGDSIAAGVRAASDANGWLIIPADLPLLLPQTLTLMAQALARGSHEVVVPHYRAQQGHPVAFAASCFARLTALAGDRGAASIVREARERQQVLDLEIDDIGCITDIDTPQDLARAEALLLRRSPLTSLPR
ncbi:nucleotidyltransferase family protein [Diaphorobacter aerolatus]|uniref:NTP transferase domain-containing protein n=1 Tax=Diaphorobacter aerolatus TaxID=1288495 RepID=A0A7H0GGU8_9BURK|nr:NTP transferase domain-containing protein [Diaphorobacter aerolatus]QNP47514.1 NTP transferase domain-containing protein [Diaphorobacter aerolatus]